MPSKKEALPRCQVCDDSSHGYHFGVIVCRACAAFFRRTIALNLKYRCRFDGRCTVNKAMRCMCRACRQNKCLKVGMKPDAVQLNYDNIGQLPHKERTTVIVQNSPSSSLVYSLDGATPSPENAPTPTTHDMIMAKVKRIFECDQSHNIRQPLPSILDEMLRGFHEIRALRPKVHANAKFIEPKGIDVETEEEENERLKANSETLVTSAIAEVELTARMVTHFRPFMDLPADERMLLFQRFWPHFLRLERAYATYLKLGPDINDERVVLSNGSIVHYKVFWTLLARCSKASITELERLFATSHEISWLYVNTPLKLLRPTEFEFITMCGHMLWTTPGLRGISPKTLQIARETRAEIFTALHRYYVQVVNLPVYAPRIGEFLSLVAAVEKSVAQKKEDALMADLFDLFKIDRRLLDIFK